MKRNSDAFSVWSFEITPDMHVLSNGTILEEDEEEEEKVQVSSVASSEVKKANVDKSEEGRSKPVKKVEPKKVRKSQKSPLHLLAFNLSQKAHTFCNFGQNYYC